MPDLLLKTIQPYLIGIVFVLLYLAEHFFPERQFPRSRIHDIKNIGIGFINTAITFIGGYYFQKCIQWLNLKHIGVFNLIHIPFYISLGFQIALLDLFMYCWHRLNHRVFFLWRFHRFHHVDEQMNITTALRFHGAELTLSYLARLLIFPLLGFSLTAILLYSFLFFPVVLLHHSNLRIKAGFDLALRHILVTPNMHRIHHSKKGAELNSNYSSVFSWWDSLFRSYRKEPDGPVDFGVDDPVLHEHESKKQEIFDQDHH